MKWKAAMMINNSFLLSALVFVPISGCTVVSQDGTSVPDNNHGVPVVETISTYKLENCMDPVSAVVQIHLKPTSASGSFLLDMSQGKLACSDCVTLGAPNKDGTDDDGTVGPVLRGIALTKIDPLRPSPFDVDLQRNNLWRADTNPGVKTGYDAILFKIILEDPSLHFYQPNAIVPSSLSDWAIENGGEHPEMFECRGPIVFSNPIPAQHKPYAYLTVRVRWTRKNAAAGDVVYGGLNIGLLLKEQSTYWLPLFLDPNIKNNG